MKSGGKQCVDNDASYYEISVKEIPREIITVVNSGKTENCKFEKKKNV